MFNVLAIGWKIIEFFTISLLKCCDLCKDDTSCLYSLDENSIIYHIYFWEQRKLSDLVDVCSGMDYKHLSIGNIPVFGTGGYMLSVDKALSYDRNAIGIGRKGTIDKPYILKAPFWTVDTLFYCIPRDEGTLNFDYDLFQCIDWKQKDESTGVPSLSKVAINDTDVMIPKTDEQKKIGYFFEELDLVITLHQHKRNKVSYVKSTFSTLFWEQRKFEEAFIERREKTEMENEDTLLSCAINGIFLNSELFGHFRGTTTIGYLKVKKNDLILSAQNLHLGNANVNLRFEHGIISPAYKVYDLNNCNPEFVQAWVKKEDTKNFFLAATTEGASQCRKNIEWSTLAKQFIAMPTLQEQSVIGTFFANLDHLITLHQRKMKYILKEVFIWIILIKRVVLKKPLSLSYRIMVGRKRLLSILQNRI